ncbi:MAG: FG-GAP repeat domain-containing protein, partial [Verrucomicrobiota bacterium]
MVKRPALGHGAGQPFITMRRASMSIAGSPGESPEGADASSRRGRARFAAWGLGFLALWIAGTLGVGRSWAQAPAGEVRSVVPAAGGAVGFRLRAPQDTGLVFTNAMTGDLYLTNAVAHNGAGVAIGDVDGDGWADIYLCNLEGPNRLFRNRGQWRFEARDLPEIACADQRSTGAALVDVDGDRDLDLLVNGIGVGTRLFLNDGRGGFIEKKDSGLSPTASATSMALADIDGDGDLDLYCTHFIDVMRLADPTTRFALTRKGDGWEVSKINGESTRSPKWRGRFEALPDGKVRELPEVHGLYLNEGQGRFRAIENEPGTYSDAQGRPIPPYRDWGLAVMFRDIDGDGNPDLYVCNDNTSPDRIWLNQGRGRFRELETSRLRHTSRSAMGVDFADVDRDGFDDFFVVDMLAREHRFRMTQLVRDRPTLAELEDAGARPQFNRNTLFLGRPGGHFVDVAWMAGVAASDWTWTTLFMDVDLDGLEDLLVTNGFEFDVMDQDSHSEIKDSGRRLTENQLKRSMQMHPRWRTRNAAFRNLGGARFEPAGPGWGFDLEGISYGMAAGDLDNDGDLDLVLNNLNAPAAV